MGKNRYIGRLILGLLAFGICAGSSAGSFTSRVDLSACQRRVLSAALLNVPPDPARPNANSRLYLVRSNNPAAAARPVIVALPGGPGMSFRTLAPLVELTDQFDMVFVDPPGVGEGASFVFDGVGNYYDFVVANIAQTVHDEIEVKLDRDLAFLGFSAGGVFAAEALARYSPGILSRTKGLLLIASTTTDNSYRALCKIREAARLDHRDYQSTKQRIQLFPPPMLTTQIIKAAIRQYAVIPTPQAMSEVMVGMDRDNFTQWILQHETLIWNEDEQEAVTELLYSDNDTCSPESLRRIIKNWRQDRARGDVMASTVRERGIPTLSLIGGNDRLIPPEYLVADAQVLGAKAVVIPNASHFAFVSDLKRVVFEIYKFLEIPGV